MDIRLVKRMASAVERFLYWIKERESIRRKKELGLDRPWTEDTILDTYRFCNVRRMDDRVSQWLWNHWYKPNKNHPNMLLACTVARHFNKIETLDYIGFPDKWDPKQMKRRLHELDKPFGAAYVISGGTGGRSGTKYGSKIDMVIDAVIQPLVDDPPMIDDTSVQRSVETLVTRNGLGWFMAGQIVADMRWALTGKWKDRHTWAAKGPGSCRGLCRLRGRAPKRAGYTQAEFVKELASVISLCKTNLPHICRDDRLEAIDYQNCLCEYDKYVRALVGDGRPKRIYTPC